MQTLLPATPFAGRFTAVPLSLSAISVPRLPRTLLPPNSFPSLPLKLNTSSPSFTSFISHRPWKFPFTVTASSQTSPTFTPSNDESEKAKLDQVAKRLEKTARQFKRLGSLGFWGQLVCTVVSAVILSFSVVVTGRVTSPATFYATAGGIAAAFISVFWSFGYIRLSERLSRTANDPTKAPPRSDVVKSLQNGIVLNLLGMGAAILGMQATPCSRIGCLFGAGFSKHNSFSFPWACFLTGIVEISHITSFRSSSISEVCISILRSSSLVVDILYSQVEKNPCSVVNKHES
ncbi:protein TIC 21, chloroplastic [Trifolium repens]|nr:protein TIC 21, chloroplastic [Trifolium repens]